jgi:hypothetical protein
LIIFALQVAAAVQVTATQSAVQVVALAVCEARLLLLVVVAHLNQHCRLL